MELKKRKGKKDPIMLCKQKLMRKRETKVILEN
jgi:hypothetical protein